jgi:DNA repair/transcription protein MET18/MMS19
VRFVEDLFDVTSCYYPINFTPRANDSITAEMLISSLDKAMCCSPLFAPLCLPFLLEKIEASTSATAWGSFLHAVSQFGCGEIEFPKSVAKTTWEMLCKDAYGADAQAVEVAMATLKRLLQLLSENYVSSSVASVQQPLDYFLALLLSAVRGHFESGSPDTKGSKWISSSRMW